MNTPESTLANNALHWHVIYTKPRQETIALTQLERQGYPCYLPIRRVEKLRRGRRTEVTEPLFNRYLFIRLGYDLDSPGWAPIRSTLGVSHLLRFGDTPARVEEALIEQLRRLEQKALGTAESLYQPGDRVRIDEGVYAGLSAVYEMDDGDDRARVLIELLRRPARLTLPLASLRRDVA